MLTYVQLKLDGLNAMHGPVNIYLIYNGLICDDGQRAENIMIPPLKLTQVSCIFVFIGR